MIDRLKTLTMMQLKNKRNKRLKKTKTSLLVNVLLQILLIVVISGVLWFVFDLMKSMSFLPIDKNFMMFAVFITQALSILSCVFGLVHSLYSSRDNSIIFSLPARPTEIFISKLIVYYISEFVKNLNFIIPFLVSFGIVLKLGIWYFLTVLINVFMLPLIAVVISAVISLPLMYVRKLIKRFPYIKFVLIAIAVSLVMWLVVYITQIIPRPLRLLAIYGQFTAWLKQAIINANTFSLFYKNIVEIMFSNQIWLNLLIVSLILIGFMLLTLAITFAYFNIVSQSFEFSSIRRKKGKNNPIKSTYLTFVKRELLLSVRNVQQLTNNFLFIVSLPFALYIVNQFLDAIKTSNLGNMLIITINIIIGLMLLTASNTMSATAISSEGSEFGLVKTAPSKTNSITWAKLSINFALSLLAIVATSIILATTTSISYQSILVMTFIFITVNSAHMLWAYQLDLLNPKLTEYAQTGTFHDNQNISKSILIGFVISVIIGLLSYFIFDSGTIESYVKLFAICIGFLALRLYLLIINLNTYFKNIQL